jgi:hypothetical protein
MLTKNVPKDNLYRILFSRMILDGIAEFNFFCRKIFIFQQFWNTILYTIFKNLQKRSFQIYNIKSIVYQYYK